MAWRIKPKRRAAGCAPKTRRTSCHITRARRWPLRINRSSWSRSSDHNRTAYFSATMDAAPPAPLFERPRGNHDPLRASSANASLIQYRELCARCWRIPVARRMMVHVWRAGEAGIHCSGPVLTDRPDAFGAALAADKHVPRPAEVPEGTGVSNQPLQSYFIDPDFAAVASSDMFVEWMSGRL